MNVNHLAKKNQHSAILVGYQGEIVFELGANDVYIGRSSENDVTLGGDLNLSRRHALINRIDGVYYLRDLRSSNGTFLNGKRIHGVVALKPDDEIFLGKTTLVFQPSKAKLAAINWKMEQSIVLNESRGRSGSVWSHVVLKAMLALVNSEFGKSSTHNSRPSDPCRDLPKAG